MKPSSAVFAPPDSLYQSIKLASKAPKFPIFFSVHVSSYLAFLDSSPCRSIRLAASFNSRICAALQSQIVLVRVDKPLHIAVVLLGLYDRAVFK